MRRKKQNKGGSLISMLSGNIRKKILKNISRVIFLLCKKILQKIRKSLKKITYLQYKKIIKSPQKNGKKIILLQFKNIDKNRQPFLLVLHLRNCSRLSYLISVEIHLPICSWNLAVLYVAF